MEVTEQLQFTFNQNTITTITKHQALSTKAQV